MHVHGTGAVETVIQWNSLYIIPFDKYCKSNAIGKQIAE